MDKLKLNIQLFGGSLSITASETDVSINDNTSYIDLTIKATTNSTTYNDSAYLKSASIVGQNDTYSLGRINFKIGKGQTVTVYSGKIGPFHHNADGTLSPVSISASCYIVSNTQPTASATVTMSTIPRASNIGVSDANIGSSTNITINKASDSFTTTLYYKASGQNNWTKIVDKTSNQVYPWTVPTSFYSLIPNSRTIYCEFLAETYTGDTLIGSSTTGATFTANTYPVVASINWYTSDLLTQELTGNNTTVIKGVSNLYIEINANAGTGASLSSYVINGESSQYNDRTIYNANTNNYNITIYDSRGMEGYGALSTNFVDYIPLTINANISRNQPTDGKINISASGNYFNGDFRTSYHNTLTVEYRYKERSSSTWGNWATLSTSITNNSYSGSTQLSGFDYTNIYDFEIRATDRVGTQYISGIVVTKGIPVYNWDNDEFDINVLAQAKNGILSNSDTTSVNTQTVSDGLQIKRAGADYAPNNGIVLEASLFSGWGGQLYIADNGSDGIWYNGWSNGTKGNWKKLAFEYEPIMPSYNLNDINQSGTYFYNNGGADYTNSPRGDGVHYLVVTTTNTDWVVQEDYYLIWGASEIHKYIRMYTPAGWTSWQTII